MNSALKQFSMHVVFAKVIIRPASFIKACTSTSTNQMVIAAECSGAWRRGKAHEGKDADEKQVLFLVYMYTHVRGFIHLQDGACSKLSYTSAPWIQSA